MVHFADDDPWITKQGMNPKVLHALGAINIIWNACEHGLIPLFCLAANMPLNETQLIIHDLGDVTICEKIKNLLGLRVEYSAAEKQMVLSALDAYDVNRLNRNQLTHFSPFPEGETLALYRKKGPELMKSAVPSDLATIRRIADEISLLTRYLSVLSDYFLAKNQGREPGPLPGIFRAPERLWKPLPQGPQAQQRQPPPSQR